MSAEAVRSRPAAVTTCAETRLSLDRTKSAANPPLTPAEREPGDAGVRHDTARRHEIVLLGFPVDISPQGATLHANHALVEVDVDAAHALEREQHPAINAREPRHRVPATADGEEQSLFAREVHGVNHIGRARGLDDDRWMAGVHQVVAGRTSSYPGSPGVSTAPLMVARSASSASSSM